jgi:2-polyprenyl-6-hydroxyphenyl methylase/3-demethylubiquinone-9 3-methyltransferase
MSTVDPNEVEKFANLSEHWWDKEGQLRTLHDINQTRLDYILANTVLQNKTVLDMGCGGGILTEALAKAGAVATGVDLEPGAIQVATKHAKENQLNIEYLNCAIEALDLSRQFDIITCLEMLEHVPDPESLLKRLCLHLKPGGTLFLSTINRTAKAYLYTIIGAEYLLKIIPKNTHDYQKYIKPSELAGMLRPCEIEPIEIKGLQYNPLSRHAWLNDQIDVNYIVLAKKN